MPVITGERSVPGIETEPVAIAERGDRITATVGITRLITVATATVVAGTNRAATEVMSVMRGMVVVVLISVMAALMVVVDPAAMIRITDNGDAVGRMRTMRPGVMMAVTQRVVVTRATGGRKP